MDEEDRNRSIKNSNAANYLNDKVSLPQTGPHISFSLPNPSTNIPQSAGLPSRQLPPSRARGYFETAAQGLPPILPQHGSSHFSYSPPISPLNLFSPQIGFPGPLLPPLRTGPYNGREYQPLTPLSPMNYTPVLRSPMDPLHSPMYNVGSSTQTGSIKLPLSTSGTEILGKAADDTPRQYAQGVQRLPKRSDYHRNVFERRELNELNSIGFSRQHAGFMSSPKRLKPNDTPHTSHSDTRPLMVAQGSERVLRDPAIANTEQPSNFNAVGTSFLPRIHMNRTINRPEAVPRSAVLHHSDSFVSTLPRAPNPKLNVASSPINTATNPVYREIPPSSSSPIFLAGQPSQLAEATKEIQRGNDANVDYNSTIPNLGMSSTLSPSPAAALSNPIPITMDSGQMDAEEELRVSAIQNRESQFFGLRVLQPIIIDRPLVRKAELLQQRVSRSNHFAQFVLGLKESHKMRGDGACGGTIRRRSDLIKPVVNIEDFGYPSSDRVDIHTCLDTTPGVSRENVEYLKNILSSQLETVKRGTREALHQFGIILVDQLRYRVMKKKDILSLQCSIVDRFVVARNCILEKYTQYVRSRRWIENMSTNQRRGCLTHRQNNMLRMWLYRNFTDPYPEDEAKEMMMQETSLSLDQVNNWLINARSRFWKPSMDCFDRTSLERKIVMLIRHRMVMTTEEKIKTASYVDTRAKQTY